ncbi:uncharacterized protein LOC143239486 isoform X2 [Tachypleus tridentatus]
MADSAAAQENAVPIPPGRVEQVCRKFLVHEDEVLAHRLQSEEIEMHYGKNKLNNQLVRSDIQQAKTLQQIEEEESLKKRQAYERMILEQEAQDARVAVELQERMKMEEFHEQRVLETEDERLARKLQEREKERIERKKRERILERERRQVEKVVAEQRGSVVETSGSRLEDGLCSAFRSSSLENRDVPCTERDIDFSDFYLKPPPDLTEVEFRRFQEEQDEELARLLQEQESKRSLYKNMNDQQMAIEEQDRELAKVLQEQERARARRAKERTKQKLLMQQQEMETIEVQRQSPDVSRNNSEGRQNANRYLDEQACNVDILPHEVTNIATVIDPTYNRRKLPGSESHCSNSCGSLPPISPIQSPVRSPTQSSGASPGDCGITDGYCDSGDEDGAVPPYMPIQGQRRTISLEKDKGKKIKQKNACKMQ